MAHRLSEKKPHGSGCDVHICLQVQVEDLCIAAHQDAQQEVQERLTTVLLFRQLCVRQAQAEGVRPNDVMQPCVLEIALPGRRLDAVGRLKLGLRPQLQRCAACQVCAMLPQIRRASPFASPKAQSTSMP